MKKIIDVRCYVKIKDKWYDTSIFKHCRYAEPKDEVYDLRTFEELLVAIERDKIRNAETIYTKRKAIVTVSVAEKSFAFRITENNFTPISILWTCEEINQNIAITKLANLLSAEDFLNYLKDKGLENITNFF